ncbi:transcriptional regulator [Aquibacillus halophilus]|uniref:Transcriptional regulator n=1 Tax=Aquibacillus halophilus TaxID=930132 RepID=A0A6A8DKZ2_9BACI|nr:BTAD domain-containing putative transcriptional regulator [Aquibacillus halophilus]MRH43657.1 transcriptional regulator [Aquibacillus halophilus]
MGNISVIQSQLMPPPVKESFLRRANLHKKLASIPHYPLTLLHAGAGYGKSTALTLFVHDIESSTCWYSISSNDDDVIPFLTKLVHAIKSKHPEYGESILAELKFLNEYISDEQIWLLVSMLVNEAVRLEQKIILILDDYHHIQKSGTIEKWMKYFLEHIPANLRVVISSRNKLNWGILTSLKVKGELLEISQEDLLLSLDEMEHLLEDTYNISLEKTELDKINQLTEGWAIAFSMLADNLQNSISPSYILDNRKETLQDLFDFLALEVLSKQSLINQQFLLQTSILDELSPEMCDAVLEVNGSESILSNLSEQSVFVQEIDGRNYRYHALFKEFLQNQLRLKHGDEYQKLNRRAANIYEGINIESAIHHYLQINEYGHIAKLISNHGRVMLKNGKLQTLLEYLKPIPSDLNDQFPILWFYQGEINRFRSSYEWSESCYKKAIKIGESNDDRYLTSIALEGIARIYLDTIQPDKAERVLQRAITLREESSGRKEEMAKLYQLLAENLLNSGQAIKAEKWYERAESLDLPLEDGNLKARLYLRTGRLINAKELLLKRKNSRKDQDTVHLSQSHRETDILLAIIESFLGNPEDGKKYAEQGMKLGMDIQSPFVEACGWMRMGHAVQLIDRYEVVLAEKCYQTSLDIMEKIDVSRGKAEPYMGLCILYGKQGRYDRAIEAGQKGLYETEKVKDLWLSTLIQLCMGISSIYCERYENAYKVLEEVKIQFEQCGDRYGIMLTSFWKSYISYKTEDLELFEEEIRHFLTEIQTGGYEFFLTKRTTFGPYDIQSLVPLLLQAQKSNIHSLFISKIISELGLSSIENHPGYTLKIQTLGKLRLQLGNIFIEETDWQRGKAKELFEFFITNKNKLIAREVIYREIWPDQDDDAANRSFKVSFNSLLKTIEPHRKAREDSFFIKRKGSFYGINNDSVYQLDTLLFEEWVSKGLAENDPYQAKELLNRGLNLYEGDYLPDRRFEDWCLTERERLQVIYLRAAEKIAQVSVRLHDFELCIYWCEKILMEDNTWEEAYRLLMYCYYQKNNRPQAIKWFNKCKKILIAELGVEPMEHTKEMYRMIREAVEMNLFD